MPRPTLLLAAATVLAASPAPAAPPPWARTETRAPCAGHSPLRTPYFGDTHVHTTLSFDAVTGDVRTRPRDAYDFARGGTIGLPPYDATGVPQRTARLRRPLDFAVVTDHSELFGEVQLCLTPGSPGYDTPECQDFRAVIPQLDQETAPAIQLLAAAYTAVPAPVRLAFCGPGGAVCLGQASLVWQETQEAAEEFYDRTGACAFTTFVGYEWTGTTGVQNLHRNVIFRNEVVPPLPTSYVEEPTAQGLWAQLRAQCLEGLAGCDVLAIPHNSNVSNGRMFAPENADGSPLGAADAAFRTAMEPVVEVMQHKGDSECRPGVMTNDELCGFEKWTSFQIGLPPPAPGTPFPPLAFVRNALKEGLVQEERLGVNPFQLGLLGSTDTHNSTPGLVREDDWTAAGHLGTRDGTPVLMTHPLALGVIGGIEANPGGLAVLWAEENSRDALFAALRRREVYGTSGTRPVVRFFAGRGRVPTCGAGDFVERGYRSGAPMGGEIGTVLGAHSPRFTVLALRDPGPPGAPGTPLQRVQIVKGWLDASGTPQEKVFEVAGDPANGATVDPSTCATSGPGFDTLCASWQDPEFDRHARAFYYARVVENPVCRWSTRLCNAAGVDCASPGTIPAGMEECCNPDVPRTIQERAWTSPIWYRPEAIGRLRGTVDFGTPSGNDRLALTARIGRLPAAFDPAATDLGVRLSDDDTIVDLTIAAGSFTATGGGRWLLDDPAASAGVRRATIRVRGDGSAVLKVRTGPLDLSRADRTPHFVTVEIASGAYRSAHTRTWEPRGTRLVSPR